jgi:Zn finger protein HypA/HybF involved in hydrogenase expression
MYEEAIAKKDLECNKCGKIISKGNECYVVVEAHQLVCPKCKPETRKV